MFRTFVAAAILAGVPALANAQSAATAPLVVTATVVSSCRVALERASDRSPFATLDVKCTRRAPSANVARPVQPRQSQMTNGLLIINF